MIFPIPESSKFWPDSNFFHCGSKNCKIWEVKKAFNGSSGGALRASSPPEKRNTNIAKPAMTRAICTLGHRGDQKTNKLA